jgi:hypothetical protein
VPVWSRNVDKNAFTAETAQHYTGNASGKEASAYNNYHFGASILNGSWNTVNPKWAKGIHRSGGSL